MHRHIVSKYVSLSVLLILFVIISHGILGSLASKEYSFYCSISEMVSGNKCPERSEPLSRAVFNAETFKILLQAKNRMQILFEPFSYIESFGIVSVFVLVPAELFLLALAAAFVGLAAIFYLSVPPDILSRLKFRNWFRKLNQSPAIFWAYNDV